MQDDGVPMDYETHGGEDVAIYARGPQSHLFHGVHEQNYIARVMMYASCVGRGTPGPHCSTATTTAAKNRAAAVGVGWASSTGGLTTTTLVGLVLMLLQSA